MLGPLRSAVAALFGRESDAASAGECDDADAADDEDDDRVDGSGRAILDEVYGQPEVAREAERLERQARELEDGHDRR